MCGGSQNEGCVGSVIIDLPWRSRAWQEKVHIKGIKGDVKSKGDSRSTLLWSNKLVLHWKACCWLKWFSLTFSLFLFAFAAIYLLFAFISPKALSKGIPRPRLVVSHPQHSGSAYATVTGVGSCTTASPTWLCYERNGSAKSHHLRQRWQAVCGSHPAPS